MSSPLLDQLDPLDPRENSDRSEDSGPSTLNYFNYFTEVEEEFVRRRGKPLLISPMDWALVESWKNAGIPLHVVLRAINQTFDASDARPRQFRKINSVLYCQQEVEGCFAEYRLAQIGGQVPSTETPPAETAPKKRSRKSPEPISKDVLIDYMRRCDSDLAAASQKAEVEGHAGLVESIARVRQRIVSSIDEMAQANRTDPESLERDLDAMDRILVDAATEVMGSELAAIRTEAESQLRQFKKKMDKSMYSQTLENFVVRRIRDLRGLPRMSLFYL